MPRREYRYDLSDEEYEAIRKHENTGRLLGSETFITKLEKQLGRILHPKKGGRPRKAEKKKGKKQKKRSNNYRVPRFGIREIARVVLIRKEKSNQRDDKQDQV